MPMPDDEKGHGFGADKPDTHFLAPWFKKVEELWIWMHVHQTQIDEWWGAQRRLNDRVEKRLAHLHESSADLVDYESYTELEKKVEKLIVEHNEMVKDNAKLLGRIIGASLVGGALVMILGLLAAFGLKLF